jgi:hypothetical protein
MLHPSSARLDDGQFGKCIHDVIHRRQIAPRGAFRRTRTRPAREAQCANRSRKVQESGSPSSRQCKPGRRRFAGVQRPRRRRCHDRRGDLGGSCGGGARATRRSCRYDRCRRAIGFATAPVARRGAACKPRRPADQAFAENPDGCDPGHCRQALAAICRAPAVLPVRQLHSSCAGHRRMFVPFCATFRNCQATPIVGTLRTLVSPHRGRTATQLC